MTDLPDPTPPAPDLIDPIVGYRQWRLARNTLVSLFNDTSWQRHQLNARCDGGDHHPECVPDHLCSCGIYAYYEPCPRTASATVLRRRAQGRRWAWPVSAAMSPPRRPGWAARRGDDGVEVGDGQRSRRSSLARSPSVNSA